MEALQSCVRSFLAAYNDSVDAQNALALAADLRLAAGAQGTVDRALETVRVSTSPGMPPPGTSPLSLVLFTDMLLHLTRIHRVLRQPCGHLLLLGAAGSGRASLVRIGAYIAECALVASSSHASYTMPQWRAELRRAVLRAGELDEQVVLLLSEASLDLLDGDDGILEDVNQLLNTGEVVGLLGDAEVKRVDSAMRALSRAEENLMRRTQEFPTFAKKASKEPATLIIGGPNVEELLNAHASNQRWVRRVRANLHVVGMLSPQSHTFRERLREFPALTNYCTVDYLHPWPAPALIAVAQHALLLADVGGAEERFRVCRACAELHMCAVAAAEDGRAAGAAYQQLSTAACQRW